MHMGLDYILVDLSVEFSDHICTGKLELLISKVGREVKFKCKNLKRVFIEAESKF